MLIRLISATLAAALLIPACSGGVATDGPRAPAPEQTCSIVGADQERVDPAEVLAVEDILKVARTLVPEGGSFPFTEFSVPLPRERSGDDASEDDRAAPVAAETTESDSEEEPSPEASPAPIHILVSELPEEAVARLRDAIVEGRTKAGGDGLPSRFRLRIDEGPEGLRLGTERSWDCAPRLVDPRKLSRELQSLARDLPAGGYQIWMEAFVNEDGMVANARIAEPTGGFPGRVELIPMITRQRFHPALRDGIPTPVWVRLPVSLR